MGARTAAGLPVGFRLRRVLLLGLVLFLAIGVAGTSPASAAAELALQLTLPPPTGRDRVGVVPLHLVDRSRPDPWVPSQPVRELMVSLWYPTQRAHDYPPSRGCLQPRGPGSNRVWAHRQVSCRLR
jgi:hypothetical protein